MKRAACLLLCLAGCAQAAAPAASVRVGRYEIVGNGVTLQLSAPRADILRIRAAAGALGEDASWAVAAGIRATTQPLSVTEDAAGITLDTGQLRARIDRHSLHLRIEDAAGRVVFEDAPGTSLSFGRSPLAAAAPTLRLAMPDDAHYFGLGDKAGPLDRRGQSFALWNTDAGDFTPTTDPLYKSIPFLLVARESGSSAGLFVDTPWRSHFDFGRSERDTLVIGAEGGGVDCYVMTAPDPKGIVRAYAWLTGTPPLAPLWALGFQQSRYSYLDESAARGIADRLRAERIPADALYLDIDYQDRNRPFTVSKSAYPDLAGLVARLSAQDLRLVLITDPHIARAPDQGYAPYDSGLAQGYFVRGADGRPLVAEVWPGPAVFPDFTRPDVRSWWGGLYTDFVRAGVAGFWNDMNEPAIFQRRDKTMPLDAVHRIAEPGLAARDAGHAEVHNVYGMLNSRATYEGLLKLSPAQRPFVLTRASYAGGQKYAATWTGDNSSSWSHLRQSVPQLVNLSLSGFSLAGADIGGFAGSAASPDLLTRWIQVGAFTPLFRDHAAKEKPAQEPWVDGEAHTAIRRRYIEERYRLLPYLYALEEESSRSGLPLMRPVFLEFPSVLASGESLYFSQDQFMLGPDLLVAPPPDGESAGAYRIRLPGEGWYDYWTGQRVSGARLVETPRIDRLPVFVRPGTMLPRQGLVQSTRQRPQGPLQIDVYPGPDCGGQLYLDDGESFAYRNGDYLRQALHCRIGPQALAIDFDAREGRHRPWWTDITVIVHGQAGQPARIRLGTRTLAGDYDAAQGTLRIALPDLPAAASLRIETGATQR